MNNIILQNAYNLISFGAPKERDFVGYNKPHWNAIASLLPANFGYDLEQEVVNEVAKILVHYSRQIPSMEYELIKIYVNGLKESDIESVKHHIKYKTISDACIINAWEEKENVTIQFNYNKQVINLVKELGGTAYFNLNEKNEKEWFWMMKKNIIQHFITKLNELGGVVTKGLEDVLHDLDEEQVNPEEDKSFLEVREDNNKLFLSFGKNWGVIEVIKTIPGRKWNPDTTEWSIPVCEAENLYNEIKTLTDAEALTFWMEEEEEQEINLDYLETMFAGKFKLFEHQVEGIKFLLTKEKGINGSILADDMGLGKTRQAVIAANHIFNELPENEINKILVICPSTLKLTWAREILACFEFDVPYIVTSKCWDQEKADSTNWIIINYDVLYKYEEQLKQFAYTSIIIDEAHYIKNKSKRTMVVVGGSEQKKIEGKVAKVKHNGLIQQAHTVFPLTGTPITNKPHDIFNLLKAINHPLSRNYKFFIDRYCDAHMTPWGLDISGSANISELRQRISNVMLRRTKEECLDLPEKIRRVVPVEIDLKEYNKHWKDYLKKLEEEHRVLQAEGLIELLKCRQAAAIEKAAHSISLAEDIIENGEKVIIFTNFTEVVTRIMAHFGDKAVKVVGGMNDRQKQESVDQFQTNPKVQVFVGNIRAAGVGITLTAATQEIHNDYSFVPSDHLQAEDRAYRIGQKNAVTVTYLDAVGTTDEVVSGIVASKLVLISELTEGKTIENNSIFGDLFAQIMALK